MRYHIKGGYMENNEQRLKYIDIAKGIAIIVVVMSHVGYYNLFSAYIGQCYIQMFFLITGYVMAQSKSITAKSKKEFLCIRAQRLLRPYIFYNCIIMVCYIPLAKINGEMSISFFVTNIIGIFYARKSWVYPYVNAENSLMSLGNSPMWYLPCAFVSNFLLYSIVKIKKWGGGELTVIWGLFCIAYIFGKSPILMPWSLDIVPVACIFMLVGYWLKKLGILEKLASKNSRIIIILFILLYILLVSFDTGVNLSIREYGGSIILSCLIGIIGSIILLLFCLMIENIKWIYLIFGEIGKNTIPILGLHIIINKYLLLLDNFLYNKGILLQWNEEIKVGIVIFVSLYIGKLLETLKLKYHGLMSKSNGV